MAEFSQKGGVCRVGPGSTFDLAGLPSLDAVAADPAAASALPPEEAHALALRCLCALGALQLQTLRTSATLRPGKQPPDRLIRSEELAELLSCSVSWIEKHTADLPPRRSLAGSPRWLLSDVLTWMKATKRYGK